MHLTFNTYLLGPRETVCFVVPRPLMFPSAPLRETSVVEGPQNILLSQGSSKQVLYYHTKCQIEQKNTEIEKSF